MTYPQAPIPDSLPSSLRIRRFSLEVVDVVFCIAYITLGGIIGVTLIWGPARYHDTKSVEFVAGLGLQWWIIGAIFLVYAVALTNYRTRVGGWWLGAALFAYYLWSLIHAAREGFDVSAFGFGAAIAATLSQISGAARSMVAAEWRG